MRSRSQKKKTAEWQRAQQPGPRRTSDANMLPIRAKQKAAWEECVSNSRHGVYSVWRH